MSDNNQPTTQHNAVVPLENGGALIQVGDFEAVMPSTTVTDVVPAEVPIVLDDNQYYEQYPQGVGEDDPRKKADGD